MKELNENLGMQLSNLKDYLFKNESINKIDIYKLRDIVVDVIKDTEFLIWTRKGGKNGY